MPSSRSSRQLPSRTFENYTLSLVIESNEGLTRIPQNKFKQIPGNVGLGGTDDGYSDDIDIGFSFTFDGRVHKKFKVSPNGWMMLLDPANPAFNITDVMVNTYENARINSSFIKEHVLLAVWYDDIVNTYDNPASALAVNTDVIAYNEGLREIPRNLDLKNYAVQYYNDDSSPQGRRLIVRWNSMSYTESGAAAQARHTLLRYEAVIYENGRIEYRYAPLEKIGVTTSETATIGVFMPGGTWRFRDFSYELGYKPQRTRYKYGGAVSGSFVDTAQTPYNVPYGTGLTPSLWPAQVLGATFVFNPPSNRRKVLPRLSIKEKDSRLTLPTVARTGDRRSGASNIFFDDRKSLAYRSSGVVVNYPTTLPRFYAPSLGQVFRNQDLFVGDFEITGGISKSAVQEYLEDTSVSYVSPFEDHNRFELSPGAFSDSFFATGSAVNDVGEGFKQPLQSKTQIKLSFNVDHKTTMVPLSSSVYYFNPIAGRWQYPTASFFRGRPSDLANPETEVNFARLIETDRGFNAFGFNMASGSVARGSSANATDGYFGSAWTRSKESEILLKQYDKSITVNQEYQARQNESFLLPIQQPFLIEKAIIELPIEAGPGWFDDMTKCFIPLSSLSPVAPSTVSTEGTGFDTFDIGGPGVTVALYNQVSTGPNLSKRDLILSGTITHKFDDVGEIVYNAASDVAAGASAAWDGSGPSKNDDSGEVWQVTPRGFRAYGGIPTTVINPTSTGTGYFFTGSVMLKCQAEISNGILVKDAFYITAAYTGSGGGGFGGGSGQRQDAYDAITTLFSSSLWSADNIPTSITGGTRKRTIMNVNNLGRAGIGFQPSGRSVLGKEYAAIQGDDVKYYTNPFGEYGTSAIAAALQSRIARATGSAGALVYATSVIARTKCRPSPYLIMPGDRLVLSVSKSRPVFFSTVATKSGITYKTSGSIRHDIKLTTGSINITLYGSLVANGSEFHDTLNQPLASDAIHEVVIGGTNT